MFVPLSNSRLRPEFQGVTFSSCGTLIAAASNRNDIVIFDVRIEKRCFISCLNVYKNKKKKKRCVLLP